MKNIFLVLNKEKIYAYVVSIMTIVTIFFMSSLINSDLKETEVTSSKSIENNAIEDAVSTSIPYDASEYANDDKSKDSIKENISKNEASNSMEQSDYNTSNSAKTSNEQDASSIVEENNNEESSEQ